MFLIQKVNSLCFKWSIKRRKMKSDIKKIFITEEDVRFFQYLYAVKVSTYERAARDIYARHKVKSVGERIRKMEDNNLVEGWRNRKLMGGKRVVNLTQKGFDLFVKNEEEQRVELKSGCVEHDLCLVDIRYILMKQEKIKMYLTENEIQTWGSTLHSEGYSSLVYLRFDAVVEIQFSGGTIKVPIEYDAHHKSKTRYMAFVDKYYNSSGVGIAFVVCGQNKIMKSLKEIEKKKVTSLRPMFFYILKSDLLKSETPNFVNYRGNKLIL